MRIAVLAHHVAPIAPPFIGGVESHTWTLARGLVRRGHDVTLYALPGSHVPGARIRELEVDGQGFSTAARQDVSSMPADFVSAHHAYLAALLDLAARREFDAVHINTLHYLPVAMAATLPVRPLLTLHCPPTPWLESALRIAGRAGRPDLDIVAVSPSLVGAWQNVLGDVPVVWNGVDLDRWIPGPGGERCVWAGRIVPEKGPHLAIDAARQAGRAITLAGPVIDRSYFEEMVVPRLGPDAEYVGHLEDGALRDLLGASAVAVQSPAWEEPFGLAAAEAVACGTPVATFPRGALAEVIGTRGGAVAENTTVSGLAAAIRRAASLDRRAVREQAEAYLGSDAMVERYEAIYRRSARRSLSGASGASHAASAPRFSDGLRAGAAPTAGAVHAAEAAEGSDR